MNRRRSRQVRIGSVAVGGGAPVSVQSMTNTDTCDVETTLGQIRRLADAGCEIVRVAVPSKAAADALRHIVESSGIPVVADIHFDYTLALASIDAGCAAVRLNPGNIRDRAKMAEVARAAASAGIPIRVGVNSGSLEDDARADAIGPSSDEPHATARRMAESALRYASDLQHFGLSDIILSVKSSDVPTTVEAYRLLAERCDWPLHLGVTATGCGMPAVIRSAVGIGSLLLRGIGDTLRVSLTGDPVDEVVAGWEILRSVGLRERGARIVACPTCGRCEVDLPAIVEEVKQALEGAPDGLTVAVMGCIVNGPGEARECDVGVACSHRLGLIFRKGEVVRRVSREQIASALVAEIEAITRGKAREGAARR